MQNKVCVKPNNGILYIKMGNDFRLLLRDTIDKQEKLNWQDLSSDLYCIYILIN